MAQADPGLAPHYRLIVPDLRGYGESDKPAAGYDKRTMAADIRALMDKLGISRVALIGHDRGARVATRFAKDHPDAIARLGVLDNIPTKVIFERMDATIARGHWFFIFNTVADLPEALIYDREEIWLRFILQGWTYDPEVLTPEEIATYVRSYRRPGAVRGAMSDYRAGKEDVAQDKEDADRKLACPTLALWGQDFELVGRMFDVEAIWREMASDLRAVSIPQCGHLPHEERPDAVNTALLDFLSAWTG
ncbi:MAG: alpha/beta hydrolase [Pseudomonadota bacterium]|nr:alpha/beta hydrolase [Pseudomonadota bacterium]